MSKTLEDNQFDLRVTREVRSLVPGSIRRGLAQSENLTAVTQIELERDLHDGHFGKQWITRDNPYLGDLERDRLDASGLIRVGTIVTESSVLASILEPAGLPQKGRTPIQGNSWCVPAEWDGAEVVAVERESSAGRRREFPRGVLERIRVQLRKSIPFYLSDSIAIGDVIVPTRFLIDDEQAPKDPNGHPADLVIPHTLADELQLAAGDVRLVGVRRVGPVATDILRARSTGRYSLITLLPLGAGPGRRGGVSVTDEHIKWLAERNLLGLVSEFTSLKSDDLQNRPTLHMLAKARVDANIDLSHAAPESLLEMQQYLRALGLAIETRSREGCVAVTLRPATDSDITSRSSGAVTKPETIHYRTYLPESGGLFCETVFGPEDSSLQRRRRSGHLELTEPVIPIFWRLGSKPVLARVLDCSPDQVEALVRRFNVVYEKEGARQFRGVADPVDERLLDAGWTNLGTGIAAIQALLARTSPDRIPPTFGTAGERFFLRTIPVIPPDLRPLVLLDSGNFATSDLNDFYRRVINRNNRLRKLKELNAPAVIISNEIQELQREVDCLHANSFVPPRKQVTDPEGRPLKCLLSLVTDRITNLEAKKEDYAGRARAITDSNVDARHVGIPEAIFDELRLQTGHPVLLTATGPFVARLPQRIAGPLLHLNAADADVFTGADQIVSVHRPLTQSAQKDARRLLMSDRLEVSSPCNPDDWCRHSDPGEMLDDLIDAAVSNRTATMTSSRGLSLFGTGPTTSNVPDQTIPQTTHWIDTPPKSPPKPLPSIEALISTVEAHRRPCCLWHVEELQGDSVPAQGRVGGLPWMPPGAKWPCDALGEPYEFVGQFPLDPARQAGLIPFDVPPRSLLTVFWTGQWENAASTDDGTLMIHGSDSLVELQPPDDLSAANRFEVRCEITDVYPDTGDALEIVLWEVEGSVPQQFTEVREDFEKRFPNPRSVSRIGGYPYWIQAAESIPFVAQICSDGVSEICFSDGGSMYIYGSSSDKLSAFVQSYLNRAVLDRMSKRKPAITTTEAPTAQAAAVAAAMLSRFEAVPGPPSRAPRRGPR